jgi:RNA polymerase sigma factor (sigma-70 family)
MTSVSPDQELVSAYAKEGSESAFRSLVARHVDLVYATALRQVGDAGLAEEVTQNVFVALARKAPRLAGLETLAGWLHRTALLEAKARIRAELRRQRREDTAARLAVIDQPHGEPDNSFSALVPLLDEALLQLRDTDRIALVLRFLEDRSLRDVGTALGVDEDAARKRVSRALDRVTAFFRQRGFPIGTGAAAVFAQATQAAPATVALTATQCGLAAGGAATGLNLVLLHLMSLTKTQTAVICAVLAAAPLAYQQRAIAEAERQHARATADLSDADVTLASLNARLAQEQDALRRAQLASISAEARLAKLEKQRADLAKLQPYHWDDTSPVVRVPKALAKAVPIEGMQNKSGALSDLIKEGLQMTDTEAAAVERATRSFLERIHAAQAETMQAVSPSKADLGDRKPEDVRVFEIGGVPETFASLRSELFETWKSSLGDDRAELLVRSVGNWMPADDKYYGLNSGMAVHNRDHRVIFFREFSYPPSPTGWGTALYWSLNVPGSGQLWSPIPVEDIPPYLKAHLQDWINQAAISPENPRNRAFNP